MRAFRDWRPIRPNPLMPTRVVMASFSWHCGPAGTSDRVGVTRRHQAGPSPRRNDPIGHPRSPSVGRRVVPGGDEGCEPRAAGVAEMVSDGRLTRTRRGHGTAPAVAGGGRSLGADVRRSGAADPEHLAAANRAGALQRGLAVLHGDALPVLDFDLLLVARRSRPQPSGSSSVVRRVAGSLPRPLVSVRWFVLVPWAWDGHPGYRLVHSDGRQRSVDAARFWASISARTSRPSSPVSTHAASASSLAVPPMNWPVVRLA